MLVLPGPPKIFLPIPSENPGAYATPTRGATLFHRVGARPRGTPGSPGTTQPLGAVGNCTDCRPGTMVSILSCVSYQGWLTSQRSPKFKVRPGLTRTESC